ncbi:MAG: NAD-dependent epimerase/dehydratase family protein, partial [Desulfobacterales bacterium]|nr:NAD-dependent epimerase/dehydratase family protein [Desulfobacterales bacterium]
MSIAIVTGSGGLIGSETCRFFAEKGFDVVGIDNDMRSFFFGKEASTRWQVDQLRELLGERYRHHSIDIRDKEEVQRIFSDYHKDIKVI